MAPWHRHLERFERAAARWQARLSLEERLGSDEAQLALAAARALRGPAARPAATALAALCEHIDRHDLAEILDSWVDQRE